MSFRIASPLPVLALAGVVLFVLVWQPQPRIRVPHRPSEGLPRRSRHLVNANSLDLLQYPEYRHTAVQHGKNTTGQRLF